MTVVQFRSQFHHGRILAASLLLTATLMFGAGNVAHKSLLSELDTWSALALRGGVAAVALLPLAIAEWRAPGLNRRALFKLMLNPGAAFCVGIVFQSVGAFYTTATNLSFLVNLSAIFTPLLCLALGQCRFSILLLFACLLSLGGTMLMGNGAPGALGFGEWCCIGAALAYSWWIYHVALVTARFRCASLLVCVQWIVPSLIGFMMTGQSLGEITSISWQASLEVLFLGLGASAFAYVLAASAQSRLSPVTAALVYPAEAVFGALIAMLWLGESLTAWGYMGALAILLAVVVVSLPQPVQKNAMHVAGRAPTAQAK